MSVLKIITRTVIDQKIKSTVCSNMHHVVSQQLVQWKYNAINHLYQRYYTVFYPCFSTAIKMERKNLQYIMAEIKNPQKTSVTENV